MPWFRNKKTGGLFNTEWADEAKKGYQIETNRERQLQANQEEANRKNREEMTTDSDKYASQLIDKAHEAEPQVTKDLQEIVEKDGASLAGLQYKFKGLKSLSEKLERKSIEKGISVADYSKKVTDVLRYTELSTDQTLYNNFNSFMAQMEARGYTVTEVNNSWYEGSEYKGINTLITTKDGYTFEMQFHTQQSLEIKEINHKLYEESRKTSTSESEKIRLKNQMAENANSVSTPVNVNLIKNK